MRDNLALLVWTIMSRVTSCSGVRPLEILRCKECGSTLKPIARTSGTCGYIMLFLKGTAVFVRKFAPTSCTVGESCGLKLIDQRVVSFWEMNGWIDIFVCFAIQ